jgi:outer membrane protein OmpA-like peptidoglycan-associated protein
MKKWIVFAIMCTIAANSQGFRPDPRPGKASTNYVVIGAFAIEAHAIQHVATAKKMHFSAGFAINKRRNLYYVFVLETDNREMAFGEAGRIRVKTPFWDTWVFTGHLGQDDLSTGSDLNPITSEVIEKIEGKDLSVPVLSKTIVDNEISQHEIGGKDSVEKNVNSDSLITSSPAEAGGIKFFFKISGAEDKGKLEGDINVIDVERAKKIATYRGNESVVLRPVNKSGNVSFVCEVFGYRKIQRDVNLNQPLDSLAGERLLVENNQTTIPFELVHLQKGDFAVMYHVYFFKDAAIIRPESKYEVMALMKMMKENPKYKIRIHGHTNGNSPGKVISMGENKKNFFSLSGAKDGIGSAKKLSEERAKLMRDFLISEGIAAERMDVRAWGGKHPVYDKLSPQAQANVRVEIEILEDK